jgi:hypothetical protein
VLQCLEIVVFMFILHLWDLGIKTYHNSVVKPTVRTTISGCYPRMQADSSLLFKENHATWNNPLVVRKGAGFHSCQMPLVLGVNLFPYVRGRRALSQAEAVLGHNYLLPLCYSSLSLVIYLFILEEKVVLVIYP